MGKGRLGPVAGGQTLSVTRTASGTGYTGGFDQVNAWFVPAKPWPAPVTLHFTNYRQPQEIPTSVRVPCAGTGTVEFSSCPYLAPCPFGWVAMDVKVRFVNVAA